MKMVARLGKGLLRNNIPDLYIIAYTIKKNKQKNGRLLPN
jgi:hypothetical protein